MTGVGLDIVAYTADQKCVWNQFIANSKNGTFLFDRDYMDYHADRFPDASLMLYQDSALVAVMPANRRDKIIYSHQGLTYGGLVSGFDMGAERMLLLFEALVTFLGKNGFDELIYKTIPHIYHQVPAEEDRYALFRADAKLIRREVISVLCPRNRPKMQQRRIRGIKKAREVGVLVQEAATDADWNAYWDILESNLIERFGAKPVHDRKEIFLLRDRFPDNIRLFVSGTEGSVQAGVVVYESANVARTQYIAVNPEGRRNHALDAIFEFLIATHFADKGFIDMGTSNEDEGRMLNYGLVAQKEGFGARSVAHDCYSVRVR
ncbi:MAG: GNAT family N-acetyltransferase [Nitrospirae bacterium]|nr:GNAT family N-acetyltransferase [Magnetococcales bacterium]